MSVRGEVGGWWGLDHLQWIHSRHSCSLLCLPNCLLSSLTINICPQTPLAAFPAASLSGGGSFTRKLRSEDRSSLALPGEGDGEGCES